MPAITRFSSALPVRSSGRDLKLVRRPQRAAKPVELTELTKPELAAMAEAQGVDPSGTKADLVERLSDG